MKKIQCCYRITLKDGSFYIGSTVNLSARISLHKSEMKTGIGFWRMFYPHITSNDINNIDILFENKTLKKIRQFETRLITENADSQLMLNKPRGSRTYFGPTMRELYLNRFNGVKAKPSSVKVDQ